MFLQRQVPTYTPSSWPIKFNHTENFINILFCHPPLTLAFPGEMEEVAEWAAGEKRELGGMREELV